MQKRDTYLDVLKGFLIYLVFVGHMIELCPEQHISCLFLFEAIYSFHMPLFFVVSGYLGKNVERNRDKAFENLIVPTILFEIMYFVIHWILKADNFHMFLTPIFAYWYIFVLFAFRILMPYMRRISHIIIISIVVALGIGFNSEIGEYMSLSRFFCMLPFYLLGYYMSEDLLEKIRHLKLYLIMSIDIIALVVLFIIWKTDILQLDFSWMTCYSNITDLYGRILQYILAFLFSISVIRVIPVRNIVFERFGENTLQIYFLNFYFVAVIDKLNIFSMFKRGHILICLFLSFIFCVCITTDTMNKFYKKYLMLIKRLLLTD